MTVVSVTKARAFEAKDGRIKLQAAKTENSFRTLPLPPLAIDALTWW